MLKKQIFGLDISDHSLEALILKKSAFGAPTVQAYSRIILRGEVVKNGLIKNSKKLEENITKLLESAQSKPISSPYCILSLPESQIFSAVFKMPIGLKRSEIKKTISYKAEEVIPFKPSEIYYDFKTISSDGQSQEVYYVAVPIKVVDSYIDVLNNVGLQPVALDLESASLSRALIGKGTKSSGATLLIDIGSRTTNLNIFDRNGIRQSLTINVGGNKFTKGIAAKLGISLKEADLLKMKNGFDASKEQGQLLLVLQNEFKRIISEAKTFIGYYQSETERLIEEIILVGGSALLPKVDQYLADNLGVEVNMGNPFTKVNYGQFSQLGDDSVIFSNVVGTALRGLTKNPAEDDINLLPYQSRKFTIVPTATQRGAWRKIYIMAGVLLILIAGLVGLSWYKSSMSNTPLIDLTNQEINPDINLEFLDQVRLESLMEETTTTPTSTTPIVIEPVFVVTINQTASGVLNVRSGAARSFDKVGQVKSGFGFILISELDGWYEIEFAEGEIGWVSSDFSELTEQKIEGDEAMEEGEMVEEGEESAVLKEPVEDEALFTVKVSANEVGYLTVRSGPGTINAKLDQLDIGAEHEVYEEKSGWYRIKINDVNGWISSVYVDKL